MSGLRGKNHLIAAFKYKFGIRFTIEEQVKLVFRMISNDPTNGLKAVPSNTFQLSFDKESRIDCYDRFLLQGGKNKLICEKSPPRLSFVPSLKSPRLLLKKFISNISYLVFLNLIIKAAWVFGIDRTVQVVVGEQQYGLYFAVLNLTLMFQIFMDMGVQYYNNLRVAGDNKRLLELTPKILGLKTYLSLFYFSGLLLTGFLIGWRSEVLTLLFHVGINIWLLTFVLYFRSSLTALGKFRQDAWISVLDRLVVILLAAPILFISSLGIEMSIKHFVLVQTAGLLISALTAGFFVYRSTGFPKFDWNFGNLIPLLRSAFPYALSVILMGAYSRLDSVMIERMLPNGPSEAGIYAAGYRLLDVSNMLGFMFATILMPMFAAMAQRNEDASRLLKLSMLTIIGISTATASFGIASGNGLIAFLYPGAAPYWSNVFHLLICGFIPYSMIYVASTYLMAQDRVKQLNWVYALGFFSNLIANIILIPMHGAWGAAIATLITQGTVAVILVVMARRIQKDHLRVRTTIAMVIVPAVSIAGALFIKNLDLEWLSRAAIGAAASLGLALAYGVIRPKQILQAFGAIRK